MRVVRVVRVTLALAVAALLSGCAGPPSAPAPLPMESSSSADVAEAGAPAAPSEQALLVEAGWTVEEVPISLDGRTGNWAYGCAAAAGPCQEAMVDEGVRNLIVERPGAKVAGLDLRVTWEATTPATVALRAGARVLDACDGCESVYFAGRAGTSPLHIQADGLALPLTETAVVHFYVYNPVGVIEHSNVPAHAMVSVDQAFRMEGTLVLLVPPTSAA